MKHEEEAMQAACVRWYRYQYANYARLLFAIPNGGTRNILEASRLKLQGVTAGIPDLMLAIPSGRGGNYHGLFIELKTEKGRLTDNQAAMLQYLSGMGYKTAVIRSITEFIKLITEYLGE